MKRMTAILLCAAMLCALCACGAAPAAVPPTTVPASAAERYTEAAGRLAAMENVEMEITFTEETVLGADTFMATTEQTVTLQGLGTDSFAALTKEEYRSGENRIRTTETFAGGMVFTQMGSDRYKAEISAEDYLALILPAVLLDGSLYSAVEQTSDTEFAFSDAQTLEAWCDSPYAIVTSGSGTAALGEDGVLNQFTYNASYSSGAADKTISVTVQISPSDAEPIVPPTDPDAYLTVDNIAAPYLLRNVSGYLDQATAVISSSADVVTFEAGGFTDTIAITMAAWGAEEEQIGSFTTNYQFADYAYGDNQSSTMVETFLDGQLTVSVDGGEPEVNSDVQAVNFRNAVKNELSYIYPTTSEISSLELTVIGDTALLEYTYDEETGPVMESYYCDMYYGDQDILRRDATDSTIQENGGYIGIDLTTGLPLAMGDSFIMTHTLGGTEYTLSATERISLQLGAEEAYQLITGEELPAEAPAQQPTPVFYQVTGPNGEQMWLLGTIHVGDERTACLPQEIYDALAASDALAVEFDSESYTKSLMADEAAIQAYIMSMLYTDGTTVKDHLEDAALYDNLVKLLKATGTYSDEQTVLMTKPVFHYQTISNCFTANGSRLSSDYGVDMQLEALARGQNKEILSVESGEFQMDLLSSLSDPLQELMLRDTIELGQFAYNYDTEQLFEMWCRGDEAELTAYLNSEADDSDMTEEEKALYEEYETALGGQRNVDMLAVAEEYLHSGKTVFYAVGLAHLLADDGLVNTLRSAGYTVERVSFAG